MTEICDECGKSISSKNMKRHKLSVHEKKKDFSCPICNFGFSLKYKLDSHMVKHSDVRNYKCSVCFFSFKTRNDMLQHERKHDSLSSFHCFECSDLFSSRSDLDSHITGKHKKMSRKRNASGIIKEVPAVPSKVQEEVSSMKTIESNYICEYCARVFFLKKSLKRHIYEAHKRIKDHICSICSIHFQDFEEYKDHVKRRHEVFEYCSFCLKIFICIQKLKKHINDCHGKMKRCTTCFKTFPSNHFKRHVSTHLLKKYICDLCGQEILSKNKIQIMFHLQEHLKERRRCHYCHRKIPGSFYHLKRHQMSCEKIWRSGNLKEIKRRKNQARSEMTGETNKSRNLQKNPPKVPSTNLEVAVKEEVEDHDFLNDSDDKFLVPNPKILLTEMQGFDEKMDARDARTSSFGNVKKEPEIKVEISEENLKVLESNRGFNVEDQREFKKSSSPENSLVIRKTLSKSGNSRGLSKESGDETKKFLEKLKEKSRKSKKLKMKEQDPLPSYYCSFHNKNFASLRGLRRHNSNFHADSVPSWLQVDRTQPRGGKGLKITGKPICDRCGKIFNSKRLIRMHWKVHIKHKLLMERTSVEKKTSCSICWTSFSSLKKLKLHNTKYHQHVVPDYMKVKKKAVRGGIKLTGALTCDYCGKNSIRSKNLLRNHFKVHVKSLKRSWVCKYCGKQLVSHSGWLLHERNHVQDYRAKCPHCDEKFLSSIPLKYHVRVKHENTTALPKVECKICGILVNKSYLKRHLKIHQVKGENQ